MSYKKLGDIVKFISNKNVDGIATILYGINIDKYFMPSVANTIGVDLKKYKVVVKNQFACNRMHVGRDKRLPISMSTFDYPFIVSPAYDVFEVTDENVIPEYLMLWFRRSEFDRQCWFYTDADVRGGLSLDALKSIAIRIPSIEKQREIVAQYQAVANKIKVNEEICEKLEATAQAIYKEWFVDFEFPNEEGKPYKSSGGKMVFNQELEKDIPEGWKVKSFTDTIKLTGGGTPSTDVQEYWNGTIPFFTPADIQKSYYSIETIKSITELGLKESSTKLYPKDTVFITARGTVGAIGLSSRDMAMNQSCYAIKNNLPYYTHQKTLDVIEKLKGEAVGAVFSALVTKDFDQQIILEPNESIKLNFNNSIKYVYDLLLSKSQENQKLTQLQSLLLSRLATLEG